MPPIDLSVLIVGELPEVGEDLALSLDATLAATAAALEGRNAEVLVYPRSPDDRAVAHRHGCHLVEGPELWPLTACHEATRAAAGGTEILVLAPGTVLTRADLDALLATRSAGVAVVRPRFRDPCGLRLAGMQAPGACLLIDAAWWPPGRFADAPFATAHLFDHLVERAEHDGGFREVEDAWAMTGGWADRSMEIMAARQFDLHRLPDAGEGPVRAALLGCLGSEQDNVRATGAIGTLARRWTGATLHVLTHARDAWMFAGHPSVHRVVIVPGDVDEHDPWAHDLCTLVTAAPIGLDRFIPLTGYGWSLPEAEAEARHMLSERLGVACELPVLPFEEIAHDTDRLDIEAAAPLVPAHQVRVLAQARAGAGDPMAIEPLVEAWSAMPAEARALCHRAAAASCLRRGHRSAAAAHTERATIYQGASCQHSLSTTPSPNG